MTVALGQPAPEVGDSQPAGQPIERRLTPGRDIRQVFWTAALFHLALVLVTLFWWLLSWLRRRRSRTRPPGSGCLVPEAVLELSEERWAKRVLGARVPATSPHTRYSNGAIEQNFHMQLRAFYKLAIEWRLLANGWPENDPRLVEDTSDPWLNGLDEFAVVVGVYSRFVVKAGRKDGRRRADVLAEHEDSNHIWSRLVMYFSESHLNLLGHLKEYKQDPVQAELYGVSDHIELVLRLLGVRQRTQALDARTAFDAPANPQALDLLILQQPDATLAQVAEALDRKLGIPVEHFIRFVRGYKSFKEREQPDPIHPYLLELAKILPHFLLMGLVGLIWYNTDLGGLRLYPVLRELALGLAFDVFSLLWAGPLILGFALSVIAHYLGTYRYRWRTRSFGQPTLGVDTTVTSFFLKPGRAATPAMRTGRGWNPRLYARAGWVLRAVGMSGLGWVLLRVELPGFAAFMFVKAFLATCLFVEAAAIWVPLLVSQSSRWLEDRVAGCPHAPAALKSLNQLNLIPTRPASLFWLSFKYHFQPSVPSGSWRSTTGCLLFYSVFSGAFFLAGSYMFKQALEFWFLETYRLGWDLGLALGTLIFWNTMYLLRFGLFVLLASIGAAFATWPLKSLAALVSLAWIGWCSSGLPPAESAAAQPLLTWLLLALGLGLLASEETLLAWFRRAWERTGSARRRARHREAALAAFRHDPQRALAVVYMSGDDLSFHKLTPTLLMERVSVLRERLNSGGLELLRGLGVVPDDATLGAWFGELYELERQAETTLWHPLQLVVAGTRPTLEAELGLNLTVATAEARSRLLRAWHARRWLVTMMSTAGHAQDTGINLVDIALRLAQEDLGARTAFYLIQNKYDNQAHNRPSQVDYDRGELGQREKLARLLMAVAPGARAYNVNDWTPFGFKAGGLVGMDLVPEESLKLTNMLVLDRNANAHDLDALMADVNEALADPGVVNVIPGRSTTNTLTPLGQGSQLIEEGQRFFTRGVMALGGTGAETLGTGWGNIQAVYYGRVQRALCDPDSPKLPLTAAAGRGAPFGERWEGLIGFGPHADGISEDIWGVTQATHNALGLGLQPKFRASRTLWHKIRESWSHAEWFSAFPRWSGGYLQMMLDPLMQRINDAGPLCVFAKELRAHGGRFFLSSPFALLSILAMPLAIIADVSPFVQIIILLWNLGLVMNQVLTVLGLFACLKATGFNRATALAGAIAAGAPAATAPNLAPVAPALAALGSLAGGFGLGLGRWLYARGRDVMLFGPQLVIHALGQLVRQSLEFTLSGASANDARTVNVAFRAWVGPREDRPSEGYANFVNLRTVVWGVGLVSFGLNLFALSHLDFLNVLLLLPSLLFSVSTLLGPFVMSPKPGRHLGHRAWLPKSLGWLASFALYVLVAGLVTRGGWLGWSGLLLFGLGVGFLLAWGARYVGYPFRVRRLIRRLEQRLTEAGLAAAEASRLAPQIVRQGGGNPDKARAVLDQAGLSPEQQRRPLECVTRQIQPLLQRPAADHQHGWFRTRRWACEWGRSFVLGLFTLVWFFVVPIPGLLTVTTPGDYRVSLSLSALLWLVGGAVGLALAGLSVSLVLERFTVRGLRGHGLSARGARAYRRFTLLSQPPGRLSAVQTASLHALFTDAQTYFDQRSYAYACSTLRQIEEMLDRAGLARA